VAEWFKAPVLKTGVGASPPWVRIPPHPPVPLSRLFARVRNIPTIPRLTGTLCVDPFVFVRQNPSLFCGSVWGYADFGATRDTNVGTANSTQGSPPDAEAGHLR
jgi:hypothetical protein